jgi:hypothetical protein
MRRMATWFGIGACLALAGCGSPQLAACKRASAAGFENCWRAELQRQDEDADRQLMLNRRGKD